jgi:acyl-CoA synthetase (AMP-forming)/AMP-acid ligase II
MDCVFTLKDLVDDVLERRWTGSIATDADADVSLYDELRLTSEMTRLVMHQDKVVVLVSNTIETVAALLSVWSRGAVVVPVKSDVPSAAIRDIIEDCGATHVLDPASRSLSVIHAGAHRREGASAFRYLTDRRLTGVDLALIIYTSGSTGKPKGIMLTHANVIAALRAILGYLEIRGTDTIALISPLSFDYGLYQLLFCLATNCRLVMCPKGTNPIRLTKLIEERGVTVLPLIPALGSALHKYLETYKKQVHGVRLITSTGGILPAHTALGLKQVFVGSDVIKMYGLTESKRATYLPCKYLERVSDSVGIPMPGLEAKVFGETIGEGGAVVFQELPHGEVGQLFVRGTSVFQRYFNDEHGGGARIYPGSYRDDNWLATGDLFKRDGEGFLYFMGRAKDLIKQRGFCIYPRDLESLVYRNPNVEICLVAGTTDSNGMEIAKLFVTLVEQGKSPQDQFKSWLAREIDPDYMFGEVEFVERMPLSINGKVDVRQLLNSNRTPVHGSTVSSAHL